MTQFVVYRPGYYGGYYAGSGIGWGGHGGTVWAKNPTQAHLLDDETAQRVSNNTGGMILTPELVSRGWTVRPAERHSAQILFRGDTERTGFVYAETHVEAEAYDQEHMP